jgi:outer membrane protein OmpA-like peptidoglycan-associated protein
MRILVTGITVFVIWSFFSVGMYVDVLRHAARQPVTEPAYPQSQITSADSLSELYAMMPPDITIYYEFDEIRFTPDPQLETNLAQFKSWLDRYPGSMLSVTGHTDLVGEQIYNRDLGLERARNVQKFLEGKGFPATRINAVSKGEDEPAAGYITTEGRAKNRRSVISIKK